MFIFYYAVLSEVSPPTALSPFAAAAITGGNPFRDDDADVEVHAAGVPRAVRVHAQPRRAGRAARRRRSATSLSASATAAVGVAALAAGFGRLDPGPAVACRSASRWRRAGLLLFYAAAWADLAGLAVIAVVLILHFIRQPAAAGTADGS